MQNWQDCTQFMDYVSYHKIKTAINLTSFDKVIVENMVMNVRIRKFPVIAQFLQCMPRKVLWQNFEAQKYDKINNL